MIFDVILAVKPKFCEQILSGEKVWEFRRRWTNRSLGEVYLYATAPIQKIVGSVYVSSVLFGNFLDVFYDAKAIDARTGISLAELDTYAEGSPQGRIYAVKLREPCLFRVPFSLMEFGVKRAPQSFCFYDFFSKWGKDAKAELQAMKIKMEGIGK